MYAALERNRLYELGTAKLVYMNREFPDDHPAVFNFRDQDTGEILSLSIEQLTAFEKEGTFRYLGVTL